MTTIYEATHLHPRVAYHLRSRNILCVNEYSYAPYRMEPGGSIDFVGLHRLTGQAHIVECKLKVRDVEALEDQLYKYFHAFYVLDAIREVYTFSITDDKRQWLESRKIRVYVLSMDDPSLPPSITYDEWGAFSAIFAYWHGFPMLQLSNKPASIAYSPIDSLRIGKHISNPEYRHQDDVRRVQEYIQWLNQQEQSS